MNYALSSIDCGCSRSELAFDHATSCYICFCLFKPFPWRHGPDGDIAKEVHAELSILICYQLFRALFISLVVPPILKVVFKKYSKAKAAVS